MKTFFSFGLFLFLACLTRGYGQDQGVLSVPRLGVIRYGHIESGWYKSVEISFVEGFGLRSAKAEFAFVDDVQESIRLRNASVVDADGVVQKAKEFEIKWGKGDGSKAESMDAPKRQRAKTPRQK